MSQSLQIHSDKYADKGLSASKLTGIARFCIPQNHLHDPLFMQQIPQPSSDAARARGNHDSGLQNFHFEQIGFKSNIDQLYLWTEEESTRYLLHNIFCLR